MNQNSIELVKSWQEHANPQIDLLALAECQDVSRVVPMELGGQFWVIVQSTITLESFKSQANKTVFDIEASNGLVKVQVQPVEAWANQDK